MQYVRVFLVLCAAFGAARAQYSFSFGNDSSPMPAVPNEAAVNPFATHLNCASIQYIFTAAELQAQGIPAGWRLGAVGMNATSSAGLHWKNVAVNAGHTTDAYYVNAPESSYPRVHRQLDVYPVRVPSPHTDVPGLNLFDSHYGFFWNGVDNLVIEIVVTWGCTEHPSGTPGWAAVGPTLSGTYYPPPAGPGTHRGCVEFNYAPHWFNHCQDYLCFPADTLPDLQLVFKYDAPNETCFTAYLLLEGTYLQSNQLAQSDNIPGMVDDVWYVVQNLGAQPLTYTISGCGPNGFDTAVAVYRGQCFWFAPFTLEVFDNDGCGTPGGPFSVTIDMQPGATAYVAVGRAAGAPFTGDTTFTISLTTATYASTVVSGPGCGFGAAAPPVLAGTTPHLGSVGTISLSGAPPLSFVVLFLGPPAVGGTFLGTACPFHLDFAASWVIQLAMTDAAGAWSFSDTLPSATELVGFSVALQAAVYSPMHSPPIGTSNAIVLTFGA